MAARGADGDGSLRPFRWPRRPGGATLLRAILVAVLLGLAVIVLDAGRPAPTTSHRRTAADEVAVPHGQDGGRSAPANRDRAADGDARAALPLPSGFVGVPVRLAEPAALAVLRPGARVDLLVLPAGRNAGETVLLAADALVLDVVGRDAVDGSSALYLAVRPDQAQRSVGQPEGSRFSVVIRG
ncbi:flagellar biosynthesis protein FlgA [Micromonospora sp. S-DT3-3-22]|uniref:flagellar biosynthesis protein FlgA n=1 Tax=Micromonospora sp. S-DT3-3-22 TaxID=2755359 RepID=UPI00189034C7|nr:flagellar biosynthesis protein FlgA [Micromonospora sp. S-DT3-3-22]